MQEVYMNIFKRLGLEKVTYMAVADWGDFTEKYSHEFQVAISIGEDNIYICEDCNTAHNEEVIDLESWFSCTACKSSNHKIEKASEVGNIFPLETKFSNAFGLKMADENNKAQDVIMGCYGIGISRLMWVIAEYCMTEKGITWPDSIAPASHYIIVMWKDNIETAEKLAEKLELEGNSVILDNRMGKKFGFGQKAWDCELFWIKNRIAITPKTLDLGGYELTVRGEESEIIKL
jgi:prolyl-tRNA synthetase